MLLRRSKSSGFTLVELILVLAILALVAAAVAPSLRGFGVGRSNSDTATRILALAKYARSEAVNDGRTYRLNFDVNELAFWLTVQNGGAFQPAVGDFGDRYQAGDGVARLQVDLPAQPDGVYVAFGPTGRTDPVQIRLTDKLGGVIGLACLSATEEFRILRPEEMR
jgi:type II secretion system protein H